MTEAPEIHHFEVAGELVRRRRRHGRGPRLRRDDSPFPSPARSCLGGSGGKANPEELLLAAIGACFANTWAIFLKKLGRAVARSRRSSVRGELGPDPAGGFRMQKAVIRVRVPAALLAADRPKVEKTLSLAEKYCIISKVARAAMPLTVEIEEI